MKWDHRRGNSLFLLVPIIYLFLFSMIHCSYNFFCEAHGIFPDASNIKGPTPYKSDTGCCTGTTTAGAIIGGFGGTICYNRPPVFPPLKFVGTLQVGFGDFTK